MSDLHLFVCTYTSSGSMSDLPGISVPMVSVVVVVVGNPSLSTKHVLSSDGDDGLEAIDQKEDGAKQVLSSDRGDGLGDLDQREDGGGEAAMSSGNSLPRKRAKHVGSS